MAQQTFLRPLFLLAAAAISVALPPCGNFHERGASISIAHADDEGAVWSVNAAESGLGELKTLYADDAKGSEAISSENPGEDIDKKLDAFFEDLGLPPDPDGQAKSAVDKFRKAGGAGEPEEPTDLTEELPERPLTPAEQGALMARMSREEELELVIRGAIRQAQLRGANVNTHNGAPPDFNITAYQLPQSGLYSRMGLPAGCGPYDTNCCEDQSCALMKDIDAYVKARGGDAMIVKEPGVHAQVLIRLPSGRIAIVESELYGGNSLVALKQINPAALPPEGGEARFGNFLIINHNQNAWKGINNTIPTRSIPDPLFSGMSPKDELAALRKFQPRFDADKAINGYFFDNTGRATAATAFGSYYPYGQGPTSGPTAGGGVIGAGGGVLGGGGVNGVLGQGLLGSILGGQQGGGLLRAASASGFSGNLLSGASGGKGAGTTSRGTTASADTCKTVQCKQRVVAAARQASVEAKAATDAQAAAEAKSTAANKAAQSARDAANSLAATAQERSDDATLAAQAQAAEVAAKAAEADATSAAKAAADAKAIAESKAAAAKQAVTLARAIAPGMTSQAQKQGQLTF